MKKVLAIIASGVFAVVLVGSVARARQVPPASSPSTVLPSTDTQFVKFWRCNATHQGYKNKPFCEAACLNSFCEFVEPGSP